MKIATAEIVNKINDSNSGFTKVYQQFTKLTQSPQWEKCLAAVKDPELLKHIIFCNDTMGTPPVKVFLTALIKADKNSITELAPQQRKELGAFWGFVFKEVFHYKEIKNVSFGNIPGIKLGIRTAACFLGKPEEIEIV